MNDSLEKRDTDTGNIEIGFHTPIFYIDKFEVDTNLSTEKISDFNEIITTSATLIDENYLNKARLRSLKRRFTRELLALIEEEDFEYGIETKTDMLVRHQMMLNALATKDWLNSIFVENFPNAPVLVGLLRIIARIDYFDIYPEGQTMAVAALSHSNIEIQECGVRAFESWGTLESLKILENLTVSTQWLQEYINQVVIDLRKEYNVTISQED
jgi:hypothetical protein